MSGAPSSLMPAKRILVMRYRFIGDTILAVPFLRNLRYAYPDAVIDVLVAPQSGQVLENCPYINDLIPFDTTSFHKYENGGRRRTFWSYAAEIRKRNYDTVFLLKRSLSSAFLAWLSGAKNRIGYDTEHRRVFLTRPVAWDESKHEVESVLDVLKPAGVPILDSHLDAWISPEEHSQVEKLVPEVIESGTKILIHAASAHPDKMYPLELWSEVMQHLDRSLTSTFYFTGAQQDFELYQRLQALSGVRCINTAGKLSLRQSLALTSRMQLAVCVDSGPAHLAAAARVPVVTLFGPTDPARWRPWGEKTKVVVDESLTCRPCGFKKTCDEERQCLTALDPRKVIEACESLIEDGAAVW